MQLILHTVTINMDFYKNYIDDTNKYLNIIDYNVTTFISIEDKKYYIYFLQNNNIIKKELPKNLNLSSQINSKDSIVIEVIKSESFASIIIPKDKIKELETNKRTDFRSDIYQLIIIEHFYKILTNNFHILNNQIIFNLK